MPALDRAAPARHHDRSKAAEHNLDPARDAARELPHSLETILRLQRAVGNRAVARLIQRHCYEQFDSYADAKKATQYATEDLDEQKHDNISKHEQKPFGANERINIIATNKANSGVTSGGQKQIVSDADPTHVLYLQDTASSPHIDHRFPKSKGGTNSFKNARVISADENLAKGADASELDAEPAAALPQYAALNDGAYSILPYALFSPAQKTEILTANAARNGSQVKSDTDATPLPGRDSSEIAHIDHIIDKGSGGCNYYFNAQILPANVNIKKSGKRRGFVSSPSDPESDYETGKMTLAKFFRQKAAATPKRGRRRDDSPRTVRDRSASPVRGDDYS